MGNLPQFKEDRLLCGVPTKDKIDLSTLPPIVINYMRTVVITLKVFPFQIITDANCILNISQPVSSKLVIINYDCSTYNARPSGFICVFDLSIILWKSK